MADWSIKYDNTELVNSTYNLSTILDDTTAEREINVIETAGIDGAILVDSRFGSKSIKLNGTLVGSSASDLQTKIDTLNELLSRKDKNLDVLPPSGTTRRYIANLIGKITYDRAFYMNDYVNWSAVMFVADGVGKDTSITTDYSQLNTVVERQPTSGSDVLAFSGSAKPKPTLKFTIDTLGKLDLVTITDDDNSKVMKIEIDQNFQSADILKVNLDEETVKRERAGVDTVLPFRGEFPQFKIGNNNAHFNFQGATYVEDQTQTGNTTGVAIGNTGALTRCIAQSFIPSESGYLSRLKLWLQKTGTPGNLQIRVYSDNGGRPYQNLVSGATGHLIAESAVTATAGGAEVTADDSTPDYYLRAGVKYWLVMTTTNSSGNYYTVWGSGTTDNYVNGELLKYEGAVTPPTDPTDWVDNTATCEDVYFKTHQGQGTPVNWQVDIQAPYVKRYL